MKLRLTILLISLMPWAACAQDQATTSRDANLTPGLSFKPNSLRWNGLPVDDVNYHVILTGNGMAQTNPIPSDYSSFIDAGNAQVIVKKEEGLIQFYLQSGIYSTPSLGTTYQRASLQTMDSFGLVPLASVSVAPSRYWLITGGKINSFGGNESTFTFQNNNIDRGLLWNQTSNVSKGVQLTYKEDAFSAAVTLNDGFYSNQLTWLGASAAYQLNQKSNVSVIWTGAMKANATNTFITPILQNNSQIVNAIYTYQSNRLSVSPYLQYTYIPANPSLGILTSAQTMGAAILTNYRLAWSVPGKVTLPLRVEYIDSSGKGDASSPNLLYGPGSAAWSATITPTYQYERVFIRGELSYVQALQTSMGMVFGSTGNANTQTRIMLEFGLVY
jgi:hypothetical protein